MPESPHSTAPVEPPTVRILLICGSTRAGSTNRAALLTAQALAPNGVTCVLFDHVTDLPHFNPDDEQSALPPLVAELRRGIAQTDAVLLSTPEYAGTLPGSFKNLLDWTVGGGELNEKACAWINAAPAGRGAGAAATLATVLGYLGAQIVAEACIDAPIGREQIGADGLVADAATRAAIGEAVKALARAAATSSSR